jgi:chloramphenicol 3-O phosphotransferase
MVARVFVLNGGSSSGKTTTARALQDASRIPLLRTGLDDLFASVPEAWGGGRGGPLSRRGFRYVEAPQRAGTRIEYGPDGWQMLHGSHRAVRALVDSGNSVVVDDMMLSEDVYADWLEALRGVPTTWVRVTCPLPIAEQRERVRRQRPGLARGTHETVHAGVSYDLTIDTSVLAPADAADEVLAAAS